MACKLDISQKVIKLMSGLLHCQCYNSFVYDSPFMLYQRQIYNAIAKIFLYVYTNIVIEWHFKRNTNIFSSIGYYECLNGQLSDVGNLNLQT